MTITQKTRAWAFVASGLLVAVAALASARYSDATVATASRDDVRPIAYTADLSHLAAPAINAAQALVNAEGRLGNASAIKSTRVEEPPSPEHVQGTWLRFLIDAPAVDERSIRAQWHAALVAGAVAESVALTPGVPQVAGVKIDIRLPDGTVRPEQGGGMGEIARGQSFTEATDNQIQASIRNGLGNTELKLLRSSVVRADQPAPDVVVQTDNPQAAARAARAVISSLFLRPNREPKYEGYYFEVVDSKNEPVLIQATSFRTGAGNLWFNPAVEDTLSLHHGHVQNLETLSSQRK